MRHIYVSEAEAGDIIAEPVVNERGMVILPKGAELTLAVIGRLQKMNVTELAVEGDDPNAPPPKTHEEQIAELDARFEGLEKDAMMMGIKAIAREHLDARFGEDDEG